MIPEEYDISRRYVRWMLRNDIWLVIEICKLKEVKPFKEELILKVLRHRNCIGMICELREKLVGYMVYQLLSDHLRILFYNSLDTPTELAMRYKLHAKLSTHRRMCITWNGISAFDQEGKRHFFRKGSLPSSLVNQMKRMPGRVRWDFLQDQGIIK